MCGIVGIIKLNARETVDEARLKRMRDVLHHRGPDGEGLSASSRILDAGCGSGLTAAKLMQRGYAVWGIDLTEPVIRQARELCGTDQFGVGDIEHIPFEDNTFDGVASLGVIEYQESDEPALREFTECSVPGVEQ